MFRKNVDSQLDRIAHDDAKRRLGVSDRLKALGKPLENRKIALRQLVA